jgi:hypothetical protein
MMSLRAAFQAAWQSYKQDFSLRFEMTGHKLWTWKLKPQQLCGG